ncbi:glycosyltransferase family 4 protein, partial [bacterium]|nr:glycosyltransferase family 4 protein [bacterium]
ERYIKPKLNNILSSEHYDLIISYTEIYNSFITDVSKKYNIPVIFNINTFTNFRAKPIATHYFKRGCSNSWGLLFGSTPLEKDFMKYHSIKHDNTFIVYMPIDTKIYSPIEPINPDNHNVIAAGRLTKLKKYDLLLNAMNLVLKEIPDSKLLIAGEGDQMKKLKNLTVNIGIERNIEFLGFQENMLSIYHRGSIFAHTCEYETFCRVIAESLSCGIPTVTSSKGGPEEILADGVGGYVVEPTPEKISEKIIYLLKNPEIRLKLGMMGRKKAIENFSIPIFDSKMEKIYRLVLEK